MSAEVAFTLLIAGGFFAHLGEHALEHGAVLLAYGLGLLGILGILLALGALAWHAWSGV